VRLLPRFLRPIIRTGRLRVLGPGGYDETFGPADGRPSVTVRFTDPSLDWKIPLNPELYTAEAFMDGRLVVEDGPEGGTAADLLAVVTANRESLHASPAQRALRAVRFWSRRIAQHNPRVRARKNVAHHYDLGNSFYRLWLDWDMQYSCAYFPRGDETLEEAQTAKKRHIAAKLRLEPGQRVLEIGCGWGGMALYLASIADVEVHAVTLSTEQLAAAQARARAAGLADRVRFELVDYRDVTARYDRVVSVAMLEAVGIGHLDEYFAHVRDRLTEDGLALVHTITQIDPPGSTGPFIGKYIFPGGYTPRLSEIGRAMERALLWPTDIEVWRLHYAKTLRAWRDSFERRRPEIEAMYDARFGRMWEFYLASAETGFSFGTNAVLQVQLARRRDAAPLTRDYIAPAAAALAAREAEVLPRLRRATAAAFGEAPEHERAIASG
jgi:cyclopropane-fatty-acyl-phospholipid synthase